MKILSNAQIRIARPYKFGVLLLQWNRLGNTNTYYNGLSIGTIMDLKVGLIGTI